MTLHPITAPSELVEQWFDASVLEGDITYDEFNFATLAARWGADQELEACIDVLSGQYEWDLLSQCTSWKEFRDLVEEILRTARRPMPLPPTLKALALAELKSVEAIATIDGDKFQASYVRRALEALPDDLQLHE